MVLFGRRRILASLRRTHTASPLFDDTYAMAQAVLAQDPVDGIRDPATTTAVRSRAAVS